MHLPIGVSDFRKLITTKSSSSNEGYLYVDKSLFIKEIVDDLTEVIVITRPRRFGKTLNLSMLQHFFAAEVEGAPTAGLFAGLAIAKQPECMQLQGKYPVIFISFKDVGGNDINEAIDGIYEEIRILFNSHRYLLDSDQITEAEKNTFKKILAKTAPIAEVKFSLLNLSELLQRFFGQEVYIFIDEYDTPIQDAYLNNYYDKIISFMRRLFGKALKGNANLKQAVLTGILRVSKESLFSSINNVEIYSVLNKKYSNCFGFTEAEVNTLLITANTSKSLKETKEWYNGYNFAGTTIYNPLSIVKFIKEEGKLKAYWVNTSGNELIKQLIISSGPEIKDKITALIAGDSINEIIDEHIVFGDLDTNPSALWNLFLMSGYLKAISVNTDEDDEDSEEYELSIPNKEIDYLYRKIVREWLSGARGLKWYREFLNDLTTGKVVAFEEKLQTLIIGVLSYHDVTSTSQESFYHGLMLGLVVGLKDTHEIRSNKESGKGRYDVLIIPKEPNNLGIVMEFKAIDDENQLENEANIALEQINRSNYIAELKQRGITKICKMGIAFSRKAVKLAWQ